jgi:hypothetical protein
MIDNLQQLTPDVARSANTVSRCHDRLSARRRRIEARIHARPARLFTAERWLAASICVVYLFAMARDLLAVAAMR